MGVADSANDMALGAMGSENIIGKLAQMRDMRCNDKAHLGDRLDRQLVDPRHGVVASHDQDELFAGEVLRRKVFIHRSEEHTSELQSLMRLPYAVFCLKKK